VISRWPASSRPLAWLATFLALTASSAVSRECRPVPDPRDRERPLEQRPVRLQDRQHQHQEAPERQRVRRVGNRPLQQLPLPQNLAELRLDLRADVRPGVLQALGRGLPEKARRLRNHSRRPAIANAATVNTRPMTIRKIIY
jgi:hypothetical protein